MYMKRILFILVFVWCAIHLASAQDGNTVETVDFKPKIQGTIRGKFEYQPEIDASRFQVRNARFCITGQVHPTVNYKAEIDLSDEGTIRMLDAYTQLTSYKNLEFTIGQMRVPFTVDAHRSPHQQHFANRSFIAKQVGNVRDVGAMAGYSLAGALPIIAEAGAFNGSGLTEQKVWHKTMSYSAKIQFLFIPGMNLTLSAQSLKPENVRMSLFDVGFFYQFCNFHLEGEYLFKSYDEHLFVNVHAWNSFINYDLRLKKVFEKISFLIRYDRMTNNNNGYADTETSQLKITDYRRQRLTGGITLSISKPFISDIRINYEKYYYPSAAIPKESERNKFVIELMTRF